MRWPVHITWLICELRKKKSASETDVLTWYSFVVAWVGEKNVPLCLYAWALSYCFIWSAYRYALPSVELDLIWSCAQRVHRPVLRCAQRRTRGDPTAKQLMLECRFCYWSTTERACTWGRTFQICMVRGTRIWQQFRCLAATFFVSRLGCLAK